MAISPAEVQARKARAAQASRSGGSSDFSFLPASASIYGPSSEGESETRQATKTSTKSKAKTSSRASKSSGKKK